MQSFDLSFIYLLLLNTMLSQDQELYGTRVQDILYITHTRRMHEDAAPQYRS